MNIVNHIGFFEALQSVGFRLLVDGAAYIPKSEVAGTTIRRVLSKFIAIKNCSGNVIALEGDSYNIKDVIYVGGKIHLTKSLSERCELLSPVIINFFTENDLRWLLWLGRVAEDLPVCTDYKLMCPEILKTGTS